MIARQVAGIIVGIAALGIAEAYAATPRTIHILALRVEFPKESPDDPTTGGNGRFDLRTPAQALAATSDLAFRYPYDLPPHDAQFLQNHLRALANYVATASHGQVQLAWEIYPQDSGRAYVAPKPLAWYGSSATTAQQTTRWVTFLKDALDLAAADVGSLARFQSFLVFNASISLQGILSTELPPLVLTPDEIARSGVAIPSAVETAWFMPQQIQIPGGVIGLNGAFAKTFFASLGLPILSNTRTGGAAVGGWTLMDVGADNLIIRPRPTHGDSVIALSFLPALPMAWEQMRLGWLEPAVARADTTIRIAGLVVPSTTLPRAVKVPISPDEYFLVEVRRSSFRDTGRHPAIVYSRDDTSGVWLKPAGDDYDAYVPGSGALIFHVDEDRIRRWEPTNEIDAYPDRQGITLVEADGWRDIGIANALGHPRASEGIGSRHDPFQPGDRLYADGLPAPGHPVSLTSAAEPSGIEMTFALYGVTGDSIAVTVRWTVFNIGGPGDPRLARWIGAPIVEGIAVGQIGAQNAIVAATTAGAVWVFDDALHPIASDSGLIARFPEAVVRKPIIDEDGSIVIAGATQAVRYRLTGGAWAGTTELVPPPLPMVIRADLDRDGIPYEITWTADGLIRAQKPGQQPWVLQLGDSLVAQLTIGGYANDGYGYLYAATPRALIVISRIGLEVQRFNLGRADSTERFTGPPLTIPCGAIIADRARLTVMRTKGCSFLPARYVVSVPGQIVGVPAVYQRNETVVVSAAIATDDGWLYSVPLFGVPRQPRVYWGQLYGDGLASNTFSVSALSGSPPSMDRIMPSDRAYCTPSPVGNAEGHVRFYLSAQADITVRVYNGAGELVWEGSKSAAKTTVDAENEILWPGGTKFASGLYLIRLAATAADGSRSAATIPVGIVR